MIRPSGYADRSRPLGVGDRVRRVADQIENDLLDLQGIGQYGREIRGDVLAELHVATAGFQTQKVGDVVEEFVDANGGVLRFALAGEVADVLDDGLSPGALGGDLFQGFPQVGRFDRRLPDPGQRHLAVQRDGGDRLVDFVGQSGRHFAQGIETGGVRQQRLLALRGRGHLFLFQSPPHPLRHELDQFPVHGGERRGTGLGIGKIQRSVATAADPHRNAQIRLQPEPAITGVLAARAGRGALEGQRLLGAQGLAAIGIAQGETVARRQIAVGGHRLHDLVALALNVGQDADGQSEVLATHRQHGLNLLAGMAARCGNDLVQLPHRLDAAPQRRLLFGQASMAFLGLFFGLGERLGQAQIVQGQPQRLDQGLVVAVGGAQRQKQVQDAAGAHGDAQRIALKQQPEQRG